ncbi:ABC transporter permease [Dongia sp.]|uniref:ABC transporter permease n=1 Tax=Dongia sp. TaxID=1977262 RepID=UPI0035AF8BE2
MSRALARPYLLLSPAILSLSLLMVAPVIFVLVYSFWLRTAEGLDVPAFQFANWINFLTDRFYWLALYSTFKTALVTTLVCIVLGYPTAYFLARADIKNRALLLFLMFLPFWVSYIIRTMSWINVLGKNGFVNAVLVGLGITDEPLKLLYNDFSVIMGLVYFQLPYMIINVYVSLDGIDRNLESAARVLGCNPWQSFWEVTLPLSLPGLGAGSLLCFVLAAGSYVTPRLLGGTDTLFFPDLIYEAIISQLDWPFGAVLSIVMLVALGLVIAVYNRFMSLSDVYRSFAR